MCLYHYTQHPLVTPTINSYTLLQKIQNFFQEMSIKLEYHSLLGNPETLNQNTPKHEIFPRVVR
jgi:hypothetical protein